MDNEATTLLREILETQRKQNELLEKYLSPLWKIRFSLLTLLILMTLVAIGFGVNAYRDSRRNALAVPTAAPVTGVLL